MDEEENVIKSRLIIGDFRHLRKNTRSLISSVIMSGNMQL